MRYVIIGGAGHTSKPLVLSLLNAGQDVTVIGRNPEHLQELKQKGAKTAIGSVTDPDFLQQSFSGADAIYTLVPPNLQAPNWKAYIAETGRLYAGAIRSAGIRYVVNLSSVGGHLAQGAGPVSGLYQVEKALNHLDNVHILHLRPGYFYENLLANLSMVRQMGILGANYPSHLKMVLVSPQDIAAAASEELLGLRFRGHSVRYIGSDERTTEEIARVLGQAIGKPELHWVEFSDEQSLQGMLQAGLPKELAENFTEMGTAFRLGKMSEDYWQHHPDSLGKIKLEDFARTFAAAFQAN
jgi:uncharacterized protein YbjT (DUF2867 family)